MLPALRGKPSDLLREFLLFELTWLFPITSSKCSNFFIALEVVLKSHSSAAWQQKGFWLKNWQSWRLADVFYWKKPGQDRNCLNPSRQIQFSCSSSPNQNYKNIKAQLNLSSSTFFFHEEFFIHGYLFFQDLIFPKQEVKTMFLWYHVGEARLEYLEGRI